MTRPALPIVGWRELVHLPELGLHNLPAKIDTGARTSSLHATVLDEYERDGEQFVRFAVDFPQQHVRQVCEAVHIPLKIGDVEFRAEISLANRADMRFPMLIGRSSLRRRFVVDSGHSWMQTPNRKTIEGHKP